MDSDSESSIEEEKIIHCSCGGKFKNNKGSHIQHVKTKKHNRYIIDDITNEFKEATYMTIHELKEEKYESRPRSETIIEDEK
jgi:hypothetical protein